MRHAAVIVAVAACGRIDFGGAASIDAQTIADAAVAGDDAATDVVLVSDDFGRSVGSAWGNADIGGAWDVFIRNSSATVSVGSGHGNATLTTAVGYADFHVVSATALDTETRAIVSFDQLPTTGFYTAAVSARWVADGIDYRLHVDVSAGGALDVLVESGSAAGYATIQTAMTPIVATAGAGLAMSLVALGATPTTLCGKLWLSDTSEPSACTITAQDSTAALQVPGISYLIAYDTNGAPPTVSFATFRYLRVGSE